LTCAGVGRIGIVDYDDVEINNLHRQLLYTETSVGTAKVIAAMESLNRYIVLQINCMLIKILDENYIFLYIIKFCIYIYIYNLFSFF